MHIILKKIIVNFRDVGNRRGGKLIQQFEDLKIKDKLKELRTTLMNIEEASWCVNDDFALPAILGVQKTYRVETGSRLLTLNCMICLDFFVEDGEVTELRCGHCYCKGCVQDWFEKKVDSEKLTCPTCRTDLANGNQYPSFFNINISDDCCGYQQEF